MSFSRLLIVFSLLYLSACSSEPAADVPPASEDASPYYSDVTKEAGLTEFRQFTGEVGNKWYPEPMGSGGGFLDYDGDGWDDILLAGGGNWEADTALWPQALWLYRNNGDGTFTETTEEAGLGTVKAYTIGINAADYDNDGDVDFYLTNLRQNMLFRNEGGHFVEVGEEAGVANEAVWSSSSMFFDANKDGWLDLFVGNYVEWSPETDIFCPPGGIEKLYCIPAAYTGIPSRFYLSNGDGTFTDVSESSGIVPTLGKSLGVTELDFNRDGWPDLAVANDGEGDLLFKNRGDGSFEEVGVRSGMAFSEHGEARAGMGIDSGVLDSTGNVSIVVGNFSEEMVGVYGYVGNESFIDRSASSRVGYPSLFILTFGLLLQDVDFDTDLDIILANGHVYPDRTATMDKVSYRQPSQLYLNRGNGVFDLFEPESGVFTNQMVARGIAYSDYDRDGDPDLLLTENGGPAHLWRNEAKEANVLRLSLVGKDSNRDAIGAEVIVHVPDLALYQRVRTGSSYLSNSEKTLTFGLGTHKKVDSLIVTWPSGATSRFQEIEAGQLLQLTEGAETYQIQ